MWIDDKYAFVDWRYGPVSALRSTVAFAPGAAGTLPAVAARRIVMALGQDAGARHHLFALCEGLGIDVNRAARVRTPTEELTARLLRAVDRGQLVFLSSEAAAAPVLSAEVTALLETLMPRRERRGIDGQQYRLAPFPAPTRSFEDEIVVAREEARAVLERMRDRFARNPTDTEAWDRAIESVRDRSERVEPPPDALVLLRLIIRPPAPPPAAPAVTPSSLAPPEEAIAPLESEEAAEFSCADEQAEAMAAAARDGVPFCLECACGDKQEPAPEPQPESEAA